MIFPALFLSVLVSALAAGSHTKEPARPSNTLNGTREADSKRGGKATVTPAKDFDPVKDAERLYKAMKGHGTNEDELINVLAYRSTEQRQIISKTFTKKYKYDFEDWLFGEVSGWFKSAIQGMMNPDKMLASDLRWATKGSGTDEATLIDILVPISSEQLDRVKTYYQSYYKTPLWYHIQDDIQDMTEPFQKLMELLVNGRPSAWSGGKKIELDRKTAKISAKLVYNDGRVFERSNEVHLHQILTQSPREQLKLTLEEFHNLTGKSFGVVVKENEESLKYWYAYVLKAISSWASYPEDYFASQLYRALRVLFYMIFVFLDMEDRVMRRIIVWRAEIDLATIDSIFDNRYSHYRVGYYCHSELSKEYYFGKTCEALLRY